MAKSPSFENRTEAGRQLADALHEQGIDIDIVLAIPRGGLPVGRAVADAFDVPLDIAVASKIGMPGNPELALGAVASDGTVWRDPEAFRIIGSDESYFERERKTEMEAARRKAARYRGDRPDPDISGKTVALVDDGVATGSTVRACLQMLRKTDAERIILAIPVGPVDAIEELAQLADDVVCLETPKVFAAVGQFYAQFDQVSDEEAMGYLDSTI